MIVVLRQRGIDVGEGNLREEPDDLIGRQASLLVPDDNVLDANAMSGNAWPAAADSRDGRAR